MDAKTTFLLIHGIVIMCPSKAIESDWQKACNGVLNRLSIMEYSKSAIDHYSCFYGSLLSFLIQRKLIDKPIDKKFTDAFFRFFDNTSYHTRTRRFYTCALRRLLEFHQKGSFDHRQKKTRVALLPDVYEHILVEYQEHRIVEVASTSGRAEKQHLDDVRDFLHLLYKRRIDSIHRIRFADVQAYLQQNPNLAAGRISHKASAVRSFFRYLIATKGTSSTLLGFVPRIRHSGVFRLAAIWPRSAVKKLLSVIDRTTNLGKRNYAIVLLVSRLGLRIGDILNLKIDDIDWRKAIIRITQQKTKNVQELPMSEDIGNALIDYLQNGRPSASSRHAFVIHQAPYREFTVGSRLGDLLAKYQKKAGILLPEESRKGWHSLRHSLATRLHEEDIPLPVIATILGHTSVETARLYARTNIKMLRSAALEWEES